jgi:hypothetical protein
MNIGVHLKLNWYFNLMKLSINNGPCPKNGGKKRN